MRTVCLFQSEEVFIWPLASVTTTWASPEALFVTRKGTLARRGEAPSPTFTNSMSPRLGSFSAASLLPSNTTIWPSERIWKVRSLVSVMR